MYAIAIKNLRSRTGLKQRDFAKKVGISVPQLSLIERGGGHPSVKLIKKITSALGIPPAVFVWFTISENDITPEKREAYKILKPAIDAMLNELFDFKELT